MKSFEHLSTTNEYINQQHIETIARHTCERYAPATLVPYQFDGPSLYRFLQRLQAAKAVAEEIDALH